MTEYRSVPLACAACRAPLAEVRLDGGAVAWRCTCGGMWMDADDFLALLRAQEPRLALDELPEQDDGSPRKACPRCGDRMAICWLEYLRLDQCAGHGVWFDPGELARALAGDTRPPDLARILKPRPREYR